MHRYMQAFWYRLVNQVTLKLQVTTCVTCLFQIHEIGLTLTQDPIRQLNSIGSMFNFNRSSDLEHLEIAWV